MPAFRFSRLDTTILRGARQGNITLALFVSGAPLPEQIGSEPQEPTPGRPSGLYGNENDLIALIGEGNIREISSSRHKGPRLPEQFRALSDELKAALTNCTDEIVELRKAQCPAWDGQPGTLTDPGYVAEVNACIARHFPLGMERERLAKEAAVYRLKLKHQVDGYLSPADKRELHERVEFFDFWSDELGINVAEPPPDPGSRNPRKVKRYIESVLHATQTTQPVSPPKNSQDPLKTFEVPTEPEDYITLDQAAALINRDKKTLERRLAKGKMPPPDIEGGGGKPHEWKYTNLKPWLESVGGRVMPARPPHVTR